MLGYLLLAIISLFVLLNAKAIAEAIVDRTPIFVHADYVDIRSYGPCTIIYYGYKGEVRTILLQGTYVGKQIKKIMKEHVRFNNYFIEGDK